MFSGYRPPRTRSAHRAAVAVAALVFTIASGELAVRAAFALRADPSILLYGSRFYYPSELVRRAVPQTGSRLRWDKIVRTDDFGIKRFVDGPFGDFSVYVPRSTQTMRLASGESYVVTHNNWGFRGADFVKVKPNGVIRVIALGASSTFGYLDRDDETYPHYLEETLNRRIREESWGSVQRVEVLNFGVPHLNSDNIRALFLSTALSFDPDVVTFYEGANDTRRLKRPWVQRTLIGAASYSLTALLASHLFETELETFGQSDVSAHLEGKPARFVANVDAIARACMARSIRFVVANQELRSFIVRDDRIDQIGYAQEVELVRTRLDAGTRLNLAELQLFIHSKLMAALGAWATSQRGQGIRFVDFIDRLERAGLRREVRSWVHLSAEGNRVLATALADQIDPSTCSK